MVKHTRDTAFIAAVVYFIQGALGISSIALPLHLRSLHWSIAEVTTIMSVAALPWIFKIFYGLVSDTFPLFGYRRKSYLILASFISALGWLLLTVVPSVKHWIIFAMMLSNLGFAATDVVTDGLVVEHSTGFTSSIYQAIAWGFRSAGAVLSGVLAGWLAGHWQSHYVFLLTMCLPLIICIAVLLIRERKMERGPFRSAFSPIRQCVGLLFGPNLKYFAVILLLASISASFGVPLFFFMRETLGFPETFLGLLSSLGWGGAVAGSLIYARWLRRVSPKKLLRWAILINSLNIFSALLIKDQPSAFVIVFFGGVMGCLMMLPIVSSAASLTHQSGVEGTLFAVLMSVFNAGQILFGYLGGNLFGRIGLFPLICAAGFMALLGLLFVERLRLPTGLMDFTGKKSAAAFSIALRLKDAGHVAYFAGGCVRDSLMRKPPQDFDIATTAKPEEVEKIFEKTIPVGRQFGVVLVMIDGHPYEVATFRREGEYQDGRHPSQVEFTDAKEDALRRDFTVNGLFYDPFQERVLDFVGGEEDIKKKMIRAIGDPEKRFEEDKLRLLRAVRFASTLGFEIDGETWSAVRRNAEKINQVSPERIREEIVKILTRPGAARGLSLLSESGLLRAVLPEIEVMKGVEQPKDFHPEGDVFVHTRLLLEKLQNPSPVLALAALFHDVGKPPTFAIRDGRPTFYEHAYVGAEMTRSIMRRLRFSNDKIDAVAECVANHMKFADVQKMRSGKLKQFVARPTFETELELHRIDCQSCHGKLDHYRFLKEKLKEYAREELKPKPFINGDDLIAAGMKPGPEMKVLLEEGYILQLEGELASREAALKWLRQRLFGGAK